MIHEDIDRKLLTSKQRQMAEAESNIFIIESQIISMATQYASNPSQELSRKIDVMLRVMDNSTRRFLENY